MCSFVLYSYFHMVCIYDIAPFQHGASLQTAGALCFCYLMQEQTNGKKEKTTRRGKKTKDFVATNEIRSSFYAPTRTTTTTTTTSKSPALRNYNRDNSGSSLQALVSEGVSLSTETGRGRVGGAELLGEERLEE